MKSYVMGIDIGGTNTDGVIVDSAGKIVCAQKVTTTYPVDAGFETLLAALLSQGVDASSISRICVGTTHAMNALLTENGLDKVGLIRVVAQPPLIEPASDWPDDVRDVVLAGALSVPGGFECDGRASAYFDEAQVVCAIEKLIGLGAQALAVVGTFAPLFPEHERAVQKIASKICDLPITLSYELGGIGFVERENAALVNATLSSCVKNGFGRLQAIALAKGLECPLFLTQNNGTLLSVDEALLYPIKTIAAGPSNSCVGAAKLSGLEDAVVIDIGGTSTDLGIVTSGFVKRSFSNANIGGIGLNFSMPDVLSVAIGGGSVISTDDSVCVGPKSLGAQTLAESQAFGGEIASLTDVALKLGLHNIVGADPSLVKLSATVCASVVEATQEKVQNLIDRIKGPKTDLPVVAVGGGAQLGILKDVLVPKRAGVANAYGAALAQKSATIDRTVSLTHREAVLSQLEAEVIDAAVCAGAQRESTKVVYRDVIPYSYIAGNQARVIMTAAGCLKK